MPRKTIRIFSAAALAILLVTLPAFAEIYTEKTGGGRADTVYVAGNPDLYPIEYYDEKDGVYKGVIPDVLSEVSKETGIDFTYISSGSKNRQKSLYRNNQAELVTAILSSDKHFADTDKITVLTTRRDGERIRYCIVFTDVLSPDKKGEIKAAIDKISVHEKTGFLLKNAERDFYSSKRKLAVLMISAGAVVLLAALAACIYFVKEKRKENEINAMIDKNTGVGNDDYFVYVYDNLISEQAKNLYTLAYVAFDTASFEDKKSGETVKNVEKYAAVKLNTLACDSEYISYVDKGVFAFLFRAKNEKSAQDRVEEIVTAVNKYVAEFVKNCDDLFKIGYFRLCDNAGVNSETAFYNAKQGYIYAKVNGAMYHVGTKALADENKKSEALATQVDDALKKGEFKIYMQFIADSKNEKFCGAEVLSRWQNSDYGLLRPHEYMTVLTKIGKVTEHDYCTFQNACKQLAAWNRPPFDKLFLTCNFTRLSFSKADFANRLSDIAQKYNVDKSRLVVEITEDTLSTDSKIVSENIKKLSKLGFKVAIDDMGAGFSSLADIYDNEIDIVKIEHDFLSSCVTERRYTMLGDIISLVHNAGATVICEGIETKEQVEMLKKINCDMMQGFYYSRVLPLSECEKFALANLNK